MVMYRAFTKSHQNECLRRMHVDKIMKMMSLRVINKQLRVINKQKTYIYMPDHYLVTYTNKTKKSSLISVSFFLFLIF